MKFSVRTIDSAGLKREARSLLQRVQLSFEPNLIVGVRTGGFFVAQAMAEASGVELLPLTCKRPSSKAKDESGLLQGVLKRLPYAVTNPLRIAEHIYLTELKGYAPKSGYVPDPVERRDVEAFLAKLGDDARVLVVDDAVDSGSTLKAVVGLLSTMAPGVVIKTAVVTCTTDRPFIEPDFLSYRHVLCRFPWAHDFKD